MDQFVEMAALTLHFILKLALPSSALLATWEVNNSCKVQKVVISTPQITFLDLLFSSMFLHKPFATKLFAKSILT